MRLWSFAICFLFAGTQASAGQRTLSQQIRAKAEVEATSDEDSSETDETEVADQPAATTESTAPVKQSAAGEVHSVVKGDTLWDLSQRYLGSPWVWPKVWSYNPEITNPHWIYPGNQLRFSPGGEDLAGGEPTVQSLEGDSPDLIREAQPGVQVVGKIGAHGKPSVRIGLEGFLTPNQLEATGIIQASFSEKLALSFPDTCYISFRNPQSVKTGEQYIIFRNVAEVVHPVTRKRHGYLTHILGTVRILKQEGELVTAQVNNDTRDEILRGDRIGPAGEQILKSVSPRPNDRNLKGYVIGVVTPYLTTLGQNQVIIVDRGGSDGVQPGQTFTVVRQQDPFPLSNLFNPARGQDSRLPVEEVGSCMAIDVKETATMCLLTRSIREIVYGDRVEMRQEGAKEHRASLP